MRTTIARAVPKLMVVPHMRFFVYAVAGMLEGHRQTFQVVCCHAADARSMIATRHPTIGHITVTRGKPVHYIAVGDHLLHE